VSERSIRENEIEAIGEHGGHREVAAEKHLPLSERHTVQPRHIDSDVGWALSEDLMEYQVSLPESVEYL
jgi:hypothetical protein